MLERFPFGAQFKEALEFAKKHIEKDKWLDVAVEKPMDGERCLLYKEDNNTCITAFFYLGIGFVDEKYGLVITNAKHWHHIPDYEV